ncbi:hypothetical protein DH2020_047649 [Rehmannia glutinosa]|uniref:PWI domain-containing protein n=1 Tax=Rehmannia glutinosa TaxID=99300 RepID=A0ABR0U868_REHGL
MSGGFFRVEIYLFSYTIQLNNVQSICIVELLFSNLDLVRDSPESDLPVELLFIVFLTYELGHVDMTKVKMDVMRPWIAKRVTELIGFEDEVLINFIYGLLEGKFMKELWALLLSAQQNVSGVPQQFLDAKEEETKKKKAETDRIANEIQRKKEKEKQEIEQEKLKMHDAGGSSIQPADEKERYKRNGRRRHSRKYLLTLRDGKLWNFSAPSIIGEGQEARLEHHHQEVAPFPRKDDIALHQGGLCHLVVGILFGVLLHHGIDHRIPSEVADLLPLLDIKVVLHGAVDRDLPCAVDRDLPCAVDHDPLCGVGRGHQYEDRQCGIGPGRPYGEDRRHLYDVDLHLLCKADHSLLLEEDLHLLYVAGHHLLYITVHHLQSVVAHHLHCGGAHHLHFNSHHLLQEGGTDVLLQLHIKGLYLQFVVGPQCMLEKDLLLQSLEDLDKNLVPPQIRVAVPIRQRHEKYSPARRASPKERTELPAENRKGMRSVERRPVVSLRSPQRDMLDRNDLRGKGRELSPSMRKSPFVADASRGRSYSEERRSSSPRSRERMTRPESSNPLRKAAGDKPGRDSSGTSAKDENKFSSREIGEYKYRSSGKISPTPLRHKDSPNSAEVRGLTDGTNSQKTQLPSSDLMIPAKTHHKEHRERQELSTTSKTTGLSVKERESYDDGGRAKDKKIAIGGFRLPEMEALKSQQNNQNGSFDSPTKENDEHKVKAREKRKHKKSDRQEVESDDYSSSDSYEERKVAKRRRKEEKKLKKEERRRRREERRRRKDERRAEKLQLKSGDAGSLSSDLERDHSEDESAKRKASRASYPQETESEQKRLEIELREKALESLRAKKGIGN